MNRTADQPVREFLESPFMLADANGMVHLSYFMNNRWLELRAYWAELESDLVSISSIVHITKWPDRSKIDDLTGLSNSALFRRIAEGEIRKASPERQMVLFRFDLNRFKAINDTYGHPAGDLVLISFGRRLHLIAEHWQGYAEVSRLGGDEFALMGFGLTPLEIEHLARECHRDSSFVLRVPDNSGKSVRVPVKASIGAAITQGELPDYETLDRRADSALYWVKRGSGRDQLQFFSQDLLERSRAELSRTALVNSSLNLQEIAPRYEPIIDARGRMVAVEALSRWFTRRGLILPDQYLSELHHQDLMEDHDYQILHQAARDMVWVYRHTGRWLDLHTNVTPAALGSPDLISTLEAVFETSGLPAERLVLEILETGGLPSYAQMTSNLSGLSALGIRLALDDYPDQFSNTARLVEVGSFDLIKLSGSLFWHVNSLPGEERRRMAISHLQSDVDRFHQLGYRVAAENIDSLYRLKVAQDLGVDLVQGYLFGAMPLWDDMEMEPDQRYAMSCESIKAFIESELVIQELMADARHLLELTMADSV